MDFFTTQQSENLDYSSHSHTALLDDLDKMNKELLTLEEQFLRLGVRTHLLEVELATQFSPDVLEDQERVQLTCQECELIVDQERQRIENLFVSDMDTSIAHEGKDGNFVSIKDESRVEPLDTDYQEVPEEDHLVSKNINRKEKERVDEVSAANVNNEIENYPRMSE